MLGHFRWRLARWPAAMALACAAAVSSAPALPAEPAAQLDLARFLGRWYVIARAPAAEPRAVAAYFEYLPRESGQIADLYTARRGFDRAPVVVEREARADPEQPAVWTVQDGWFGNDERWVLYVSADYRFALAGAPDLETGWILAREPVIPEWSYAGLLARAAGHGYDVSRFRRVAQKPEQVGMPGFE